MRHSFLGTPGGIVDIVMLVKNSFEYDARVRREATALAEAGHLVRVIALAAGNLSSEERHHGGFTVTRIPRLYGRLAAAAGPSTTTPGSSTGAPNAWARLFRSRAAGPARFLMRQLNTLVVNRRMQAATGAPDVVHAHDLNTLWPARATARAEGSRLVYDSHELHAHRAGAGWVRRVMSRWLERRLVIGVSAIVTATQTWAEILKAEHSMSEVVVLRNVPETVTPSPVDVRQASGWPTGMPVIMYQGSIQAGRGIEEALEALVLLPEAGLVVVGYGSHRPVLERRVRSLALEDRVRFMGPVPNEELINWTAGADVSLCLIQDVGLSYRTSLPNKLFESFMAGTPVLVPHFGEMQSVVLGAGAGIAVDPAAPTAIARAAQQLLDPATRARCSRNARTAALREFNWEREQQQLIGLYGRLSGPAR